MRRPCTLLLGERATWKWAWVTWAAQLKYYIFFSRALHSIRKQVARKAGRIEGEVLEHKNLFSSGCSGEGVKRKSKYKTTQHSYLRSLGMFTLCLSLAILFFLFFLLSRYLLTYVIWTYFTSFSWILSSERWLIRLKSTHWNNNNTKTRKDCRSLQVYYI